MKTTTIGLIGLLVLSVLLAGCGERAGGATSIDVCKMNLEKGVYSAECCGYFPDHEVCIMTCKEQLDSGVVSRDCCAMFPDHKLCQRDVRVERNKEAVEDLKEEGDIIIRTPPEELKDNEENLQVTDTAVVIESGGEEQIVTASEADIKSGDGGDAYSVPAEINNLDPCMNLVCMPGGVVSTHCVEPPTGALGEYYQIELTGNSNQDACACETNETVHVTCNDCLNSTHCADPAMPPMP